MTMRINQFLPAAAEGDGVTGSARLFRTLLLNAGHNSQIFAGTCPPELGGDILPAAEHKEGMEASDLLLVHHSMGHDHTDIITQTRCPKVMVYHNITPAEMFAQDSAEARYARLGRQQLADWHTRFVGAIGVSALNCSELTACGYSHIACIPALVDPARLGQGRAQPLPGLRPGRRPLILAIGRIAENKRQHLMIQAMAHLARMLGTQSLPQLIICGSTTSPAYAQYLQTLIQQQGLDRHIRLAGKVSDAQLRWLYQHARMLWCTSAHEGFCMPLIEAACFNLPVIATASSNIPDTLGESGILLGQPDPQLLAAATAELLADDDLANALIHAGQRNLARYRLDTLQQQLEQYLQTVLNQEAKETPCSP